MGDLVAGEYILMLMIRAAREGGKYAMSESDRSRMSELEVRIYGPAEGPEKYWEWADKHNAELQEFYKSMAEAAENSNKEAQKKLFDLLEKTKKGWNNTN